MLVGATVIAGRAQRHKEEPLSAFPERRGGGVKSKGGGAWSKCFQELTITICKENNSPGFDERQWTKECGKQARIHLQNMST